MTERVELHVDGVIYGGWKEVSITLDLSSIASSFNLSLTWKFPGYEGKPIREGSECFINIGGARVITGYIDEWMPSYDDKTITINVSGRSKTADLVDCSVEHASGMFKNQTLTQIATTVCKPFDIKVCALTDVGEAFSKVQIEQGETAHELLTRLAKQRGVLLTCNAMGDLVITRTTTEVLSAQLELGRNIKAARGRFSSKQRFSKYVVKASGFGGGEQWSDVPATSIGGQKAEVTDKAISRYRPTIIINEEIATAEGASKRGQWERQRAIGESNMSEVTVSGWRIDNTTMLWNTNKLIRVIDKIQDINGVLLIKTVMFSEGDSGQISVLGLVPPESMSIPSATVKETKATLQWTGTAIDRSAS